MTEFNDSKMDNRESGGDFPDIGELNLYYRGRVASEVLSRTKKGNFLPIFPQFVFGSGNVPSKVALIGEAPGGEEVKAGVPFVGQAGRILTGELEKAGLRREELYITNAIKYRLARAGKRPGTVSNRPATTFDSEVCSDWLRDELGFVRPELVITLGKTAADAAFSVLAAGSGNALTFGNLTVTPREFRSAPMGEIHGNKYTASAPDGIQLTFIPLYHPASLIYNRELGPAFSADLTEVKQCVSSILS